MQGFSLTAIPDDAPPGLKAWLDSELRLLSSQLRAPLRAVPRTSPPNNPRNGQIEYATGAWATTLGAEGFYGYESSTWVKL